MRTMGRTPASTVITAMVMGTIAIAASGERADAQLTVEQLRQQGFCRIAIANDPPFTEVKPDGTVTGVAPEVARAVLKKLGVGEVVGTVSTYGAMIPGLQARRFDVIASGLFMRPERCQAVLFSEPDVCDTNAFAVKNGNPLGLKGYADIAANKQAKLGVCAGCAAEKEARTAGVTEGQIVAVPEFQSGIKLLQAGRIDAYIMADSAIRDLLRKANDPGLAMVTPIADAAIKCAAVAFRKQDRALRDAYDGALREVKASGEFAKILGQFGFSADLVTRMTREQLCGGPN